MTYHDLPKEAKTVLGRSRRAVWLGGGRIAVWGTDTVRSGQPERNDFLPIGLSIVDLTVRTIQTVDPQARSVAFSARTLLASGAYAGTGLRAYTSAGERRYQLFAAENVVTYATFYSRAWVGTIGDQPGSIRVIDVAAGTLLGTRPTLPRLLHPAFSLW